MASNYLKLTEIEKSAVTGEAWPRLLPFLSSTIGVELCFLGLFMHIRHKSGESLVRSTHAEHHIARSRTNEHDVFGTVSYQ